MTGIYYIGYFFQAMFSGSFKESTQEDPVVLQDISFYGLRIVIENIYSGRLELSLTTVHDVLAAAHLLQVSLTMVHDVLAAVQVSVTMVHDVSPRCMMYWQPLIYCRLVSLWCMMYWQLLIY